MKRFFCIFLGSLLLTVCCSACGTQPQPAPQMEPQTTQMQAICELATMDCYYHNVAKYYEEDAENFLWMSRDKKFWIEYSGVVRLGVDVSQVSFSIEGTDVTITMPSAEVQSTRVDSSSLNEDSFIVDKDSADVTAADQTAAFAQAQEQLEADARNDTALLAEATQRAKSLLTDYINNIGDEMGVEYTIHWVDLPSSDASAPAAESAAESAASDSSAANNAE